MEETLKTTFKKELDALTTIRDELKLKAHLAKADVKDEWNRLEARFQGVEDELRRGGEHVKQPLDAIAQSTKDLVRELKVSYDSLKRRFE